jgi:hypothetical protein
MRLRNHRLLYLGQSCGIVVLYEAAADAAVYLPAGSVILHVPTVMWTLTGALLHRAP